MAKAGSLVARAVATGFGCGHVPRAPGTAGSALALVLAWLAVEKLNWQPWHAALAGIGMIPLGVWASGRVARETRSSDPQVVVIDEVLGQWVALAGAFASHWLVWLGALALFRAFDIWKPPPARQAERLAGGLGIVMDDIVAGAYAALVLFLTGCFNRYWVW